MGGHDPIMRILVLGGTVFVSKAIAREGVLRGHEVVCAARGRSGGVPEGARLITVDRDRPADLHALAGQRFDAVIDVARRNLRWVRDAVEILGSSAGHWTFVSSINVYADTARWHQSSDAPRLEAITVDSGEAADDSPEYYGGVKVASEDVVRNVIGDRALIVRPGLITGVGDLSDRFGYWPGRFSQGGRAVVPDVADQPIQHIDVRDLASWVITASTDRITGAFDAVGPAHDLATTLRDIAEITGPDDLELVPVRPEVLRAANIAPWAGPRSIPLWAPETHYGMLAHDDAPARRAGLRPRPLDETVGAALAEERARGIARPRKAGLTRHEEASLLT